MKRSGRMRVQLDEGSWGEIRNAIARDNRSFPFDRLSVTVRVGRPVIDAIIALPDDLLQRLYEHHVHGRLEEVLHNAFSDMPSPPPRERIGIDIDDKPVVESIGEGIGPQLDPEEGMQRLLAVADDICLNERLGRLADAAEVERQLAIPRSTLQAWRSQGRVIAFKDHRRKYLYPLEQFVDAKPVDGVRDVLQIIKYPYTALTWLNRPKPSLRGVPLELLKQGRLYDVLEAAERDFGSV